MKLFKRAVLVAALAATAVGASATAASASPFVGGGDLTLNAGFGSECSFDIAGDATLNGSGFGTATITSFGANSCSGAASGVTANNLDWSATLTDASPDVASITKSGGNVRVVAEIFGFATCGFQTSLLEGDYVYTPGSPATATITFNNDALARWTGGDFLCPLSSGATVNGTLTLQL